MDLKTRTAATEQGTAHWRLGYLDAAESEGRSILNDDQYSHIVQLFDQLASERNPRLSQTQKIKPIDDFHELCEKGGLLGKINLRVFFAVIDEHQLILVLGAYKKEDENATPPRIKTKMRNRLREAMKALKGIEK